MLKNFFQKLAGLFSLSLLVLSLFFSFHVSAANTFNKNNIISDAEMRSFAKFPDAKAVQAYLESKDSALKDFKQNGKSASQIIFDAAKKNNINPAVLMATLQKESGLLSKPGPITLEMTKNAMGFGCFDGQACKSQYDYFEKQMNSAASAFNNFMNTKRGPTSSDTKKQSTLGDTFKTLDGQDVKPENVATLALYAYSPHVSSNQLFWNVMVSRGWLVGDMTTAGSPDQQLNEPTNSGYNNAGSAEIENKDQTGTLKEALKTEMALPSGILGACKAEVGSGDNAARMVACIGNIIQYLFIFSVVVIIIKIAATQLGIVGLAGTDSSKGGAVLATRKIILEGLIGIFLLAGSMLILQLLNTNFGDSLNNLFGTSG